MRLAYTREMRPGVMASTGAVSRMRITGGGLNAAGPNCFRRSVAGIAVSLNPWEEQVLESISDQLARTDPKLATLLDTFSRLTAGEHMPVRETVRRRPRRPARRARRHFPRAAHGPAMLLLWLAITMTLITVAVVLSHTAPG